jgi:two-component system OmpR family response regulator
MKLFLAEDDAVLADALLTRLSQLGFEVSHCDNGLDAQQLLLAEHFDAVILDIGLPGQDGLKVLRNVRAPACPAHPAADRTGQHGRPRGRAGCRCR